MTLGQARRRGLCGAGDTSFALAVAGHEGDPCAQDPDTGALIHNIDPRQGWVIAAESTRQSHADDTPLAYRR